MEKLDIFEMTLPNGIDTALGIVIDIVSIEDEGLDTKTTYLAYSQNRLFYYIEYKMYVGVDSEKHEQTFDIKYSIGNTVIDYVVLSYYDACLESWLERQRMNHRMILIESTLGLTVEQEIAICEAIGKIVSPEEKNLHVAFDRHFADKELVDKYNLVYTTIDD